MQDKVTFEYAIIRLVPKVEREEFINIGVLLFSKTKRFLGVKYVLHTEKINALSSDLDIDLLQKYMRTWSLICEGGSPGGTIGEMEISDRFRWLAATRSTIIQSSKTHSGLCTDPQKTLEQLFVDFVL